MNGSDPFRIGANPVAAANMKKDKDAGVMIQVVDTSQFTLWIFERGFRLMPSNEFMSKLTMAEVTGVISHAGKLKVLDIWTEQFFETLQRVVSQTRSAK